MPIEWFEKDNKNSFITIYNNNITIRKNVAKYFENAIGVAIGFDKEENELIIKKVINKNDTSIPLNELFKMDINASYGRINSKNIINTLSNFYEFDFNNKKAYKYQAKWDTKDEMLVINMKEEHNDK